MKNYEEILNDKKMLLTMYNIIKLNDDTFVIQDYGIQTNDIEYYDSLLEPISVDLDNLIVNKDD